MILFVNSKTPPDKKTQAALKEIHAEAKRQEKQMSPSERKARDAHIRSVFTKIAEAEQRQRAYDRWCEESGLLDRPCTI